MEKPKLTAEKFVHCVATGEADDYLVAHSERAAVYALDSDEPHAFDVILDAEASNELFRSYMQSKSKGKGNLRDATQAELLELVSSLAERSERKSNADAWKSFAIRSALIIVSLIVFIVVVALLAVQK